MNCGHQHRRCVRKMDAPYITNSDDGSSDDSSEYYVKDGRIYKRGFRKSLGKRLYQLFLSSDYCDVTLETRTGTFKAHKVVLAAASDYFKAMFSTTSVEAQSSVVSFKENPSITSDGLSAVLEFVYLGSFQVCTRRLREILEVARHLLIPDMTKSCEFFMIEELNLDNLSWLLEAARDFDLDTERCEDQCERIIENAETNISNYLGMFKFALQLNKEEILTKVVRFIASELPNLTRQEELLDLMDTETLRYLLKECRHEIFNDRTLILFVTNWIERRPEDRQPQLSNLMEEVNLLCFDVETLDAITEMPFIREEEETRRLISEAKSQLTAMTGVSTEDCDSYLVTMAGKDMKFDCITGQAGFTQTTLDIVVKTQGKRVATFVVVGNLLFLCLRSDALGKSPCFIYDARLNVAKELSALPGQRSLFKMVCLRGEVYAIGGKEGNTHGRTTDSCKVDIYNFKAGQWRSGTPLPRAFNSIRAAVLSGSIYVYGIYLGGSSAFLRYNLDSKSWESKGNSSFNGLDIGILLQCGEYLYRFVDSPNGSPKSSPNVSPTSATSITPLSFDIERYDPFPNSWTSSTVLFDHAFEDFRMVAGSEHMGKIHIAGNYKRNTRNACSRTGSTAALFRFDEAAGRMEVVKNNIPSISKNMAVMRIPRRAIC
ncbi:kelch-like protein 28 [Lineus longissimus]|uniref:kelch-like protein 28 n=1 Tax=Lineus longissimus TaxID=88925 RepID=UPI00315DA9C9